MIRSGGCATNDASARREARRTIGPRLGRGAMWLVGCGALLIAGCSATQGVCDVEPAVAQFLGAHAAKNCGVLFAASDGGNNQAAMAEAQRCVLTEVNAGRGFKLVYDLPDAKNHLIVGFAAYAPDGDLGTGKLQVREFAYSGDHSGVAGDQHPAVSVRSCNKDSKPFLFATPGCTVGAGKPCLSCNAPSNSALVCGGT